MGQDVKADIGRALARIPSSLFVLTAEHEESRLGTLVSLVQRVCDQPPMVSVAVRKGEPIMPLISESRYFGLCQIPADDRVLRRKFSKDPAQGEDPFLGLEVAGTQLLRVPILAAALGYLECELVRHMDVEGDHDLFIGLVKTASARDGEPLLHPLTPPAPPPPAAP